MALRGTELGVIGYPFGGAQPGGGGPAPSFQHLRTNLAAGFVFVDEFGSDGSHSALRPNSGIDLTTLSPANWLFPADNPGSLDGPHFAQTLHGTPGGLGARSLLWYHRKFATTEWDHISIWDPIGADLFAIAEERTEDGNARVHTALTNAIWVAPFLYYARVVSVDGSFPTVTITVYRSSSKLASEASWASRVIPDANYTAGTVVASLEASLNPVLAVAGDGSVAVFVSVDERAAADAFNGSFDYAVRWTNLGVFQDDDGSPTSGIFLGGYSAPALGAASCQVNPSTTQGLVGLSLPSFALTGGWPTTGVWVPGGGGYQSMSLSPDRVTAAAYVRTTRRVIWAPADRTSGNPDGDIILSSQASDRNVMICRDGL